MQEIIQDLTGIKCLYLLSIWEALFWILFKAEFVSVLFSAVAKIEVHLGW